MNKFKTFLSVALLTTISQGSLAEVVVIVNASNTTASLSQAELARLFMGKADEFPGGGKAVPINQIGASSSRTEFDQQLLGKSTQQINAYWSKQMFAGRGTPPTELSGDLDILKYVSENANAIGYVDSSAVNGAVKQVTVSN